MAYASRFVVVTVCLLISPTTSLAHHGAFYKAVYWAFRDKKVDSIKELFSDSAWKGQDGSISGAKLRELMKTYETAGFNENGSRDKKRTRCYVVIFLKRPGAKEVEKRIWLLAKYMGGIGNRDSKAWQIVRVVNSKEETLSFISNKLGRSGFPMQVGYRWTYAWGDKDVVFEVLRNEMLDKHAVFVVRRTIGESSVEFKLAIEKDGVYIHQEGEKKFEPPLRQFAFDAGREEPWKWSGKFGGDPRGEQFENLELQETEVPAGKYFTIGVRQHNPDTADESTFWLANGIGVVRLAGKSEFLSDDPKQGKVVFEWKLKKFETGKKQ